jgi:hypothetical protein
VAQKDRNSSIPFEKKVTENTWDSIEDFLDVLSDSRSGKWKWYLNPKYKYVNIRVDMRDGGCIFLTDGKQRVDPSAVKHQYGEGGDPPPEPAKSDECQACAAHLEAGCAYDDVPGNCGGPIPHGRKPIED